MVSALRDVRDDHRAIPPVVKLEDAPCPMGCAPSDELVLRGTDRLHGRPGEFSVVRCRTCGLMRTNPRPTSDTIGYYYPSEYRPHRAQSSDAPAVAPANKSALRRWLARQIELQTTLLPPFEEPGRLFEVGCGAGGFLKSMSTKGWQVEGIEPSANGAENARALGLPVRTATLENAEPPEHPADIAVGWMVIEHLHRPIEALRKLWSWTKPGGWLVASVPNAESLEFSVFRDAWYALQLPTHLYHYTPRTLGAVLARAGWSVERVFHQRVLSNLIGSTGHVLHDLGAPERVASRLVELPSSSSLAPIALYPLAYVMGRLGQTGRMTIWARRVD